MRRWWFVVALLSGACTGKSPITTLALVTDLSATQDRPTRNVGDVALFRAITARIAQGEPYYTAYGTELRARHYSSGSVFNWRPPAVLRFLGHAPTAARLCQVSVALAVMVVTLSVYHRRDTLPLMVAILTQLGALVTMTTPLAIYLTETWAGLLIGLSVLSYMRGARAVGMIAALLALLCRELALPYVLWCLWLATPRERRWSLLGVAAVAAAYAWHVHQVLLHVSPNDPVYTPWLAFGGLRFVLSTLQVNALYLGLPWLAPVAVLLMLASLRTPGSDGHVRATVFYLPLFAIIGAPANLYWGLIVAPALAVASAEGSMMLPWRSASRPAAG